MGWVDWDRHRIEQVIEEETLHRATYGCGTREGVLDSILGPMDAVREAAAESSGESDAMLLEVLEALRGRTFAVPDLLQLMGAGADRRRYLQAKLVQLSRSGQIVYLWSRVPGRKAQRKVYLVPLRGSLRLEGRRCSNHREDTVDGFMELFRFCVSQVFGDGTWIPVAVVARAIAWPRTAVLAQSRAAAADGLLERRVLEHKVELRIGGHRGSGDR